MGLGVGATTFPLILGFWCTWWPLAGTCWCSWVASSVGEYPITTSVEGGRRTREELTLLLAARLEEFEDLV